MRGIRGKIAATVTALAMACMVVAPASAFGLGGAITGRIVSGSDGAPLGGTSAATITYVPDPLVFYDATTNMNGQFAFPSVEPGIWSLSGGYSDATFLPRTWHLPSGSTDFALAEGQTISGTIVLQHNALTYTDAYRLSGASRYDTAIELAVENFPDWDGVTNLVIASGSDAAAVDALTASGLAGALNCPLLLVGTNTLPTNVQAAISAMPAGLMVWIVGGPSAVSPALDTQIYALGPVHGVQRVQGTDRYDTATAVAGQMRIITGGPSACLIANGENPASYYDALALSPLAYARDWPILLVRKDSVPTATWGYMQTYLGGAHKYMAGGEAVISETVRTTVGCHADDRWWGGNRYQTAIAVGTMSVGYGFLNNDTMGFAATLPDALAGGAMVGRRGGVMLLTPSTSMNPNVSNYLQTYYDDFDYAYVFGGMTALSESVRLQLQDGLN